MPRISNPPGVQMATGTYTGDGSTSQAITGVGFAPKYVKIWQDPGAASAVIQMFEAVDQFSTGYSVRYIAAVTATQFAHIDDMIISLDSDGFTVDDNGADEHPNKNLQAYVWMAIG